MDLKLFTDTIDALEKLSKLISIPKNERERYRQACTERLGFCAFCRVFVAWSWFRQNGVVSPHPPVGNANRWRSLALQEKALD
jgi:hypothetical protein